jgi:hypothetical protein
MNSTSAFNSDRNQIQHELILAILTGLSAGMVSNHYSRIVNQATLHTVANVDRLLDDAKRLIDGAMEKFYPNQNE